jgi:hypothetical protein
LTEREYLTGASAAASRRDKGPSVPIILRARPETVFKQIYPILLLDQRRLSFETILEIL